MNKALSISIIILIATVFIIEIPVFSQSFFYPKQLVLFTLGIVALIQLCLLKDITLPTGMVLWSGISIVIVSIVSVFFSHAPVNSLSMCILLISAVIIFMYICNTTPRYQEIIVYVLFSIAVFESVLILFQIMASLVSTKTFTLLHSPVNVVGTFGNSEYLATFLGIAIITGIYLCDKTPGKYRWLMYTGIILVASALILTGNKGSVIFLIVWGLSRFYNNVRVLIVLIVFTGFLIVLLFPDSWKGRGLLWMSSAWTFREHFFTGVGAGQIGHHYLSSVASIFEMSPYVKTLLGSYTANILDAHNSVLNWGAETGIAGFISCIVLMIGCIRLFPGVNPYMCTGVIFLMYKSMYTVLHTSPTGMLLVSILLGMSLPVRMFTLNKPVRFFSIMILLAFTVGCVYSGRVAASDFWYQKAIIETTQVRLDSAEQFLSRSLLLNHENSDAHLAYAHVLFLRQDTAKMSVHADSAIALFRTMNSLKISAHMYYYSKMYDKAFTLYSTISECFPDHLTSLVKLSQIYLYKKNFKAAHDLASKVIDLQPRKTNDSDYRNMKTAGDIINITGPLLYGGVP